MTRVHYCIFLILLKTTAAYARQSGFSTDCVMAIKLKFHYSFILHKLNNLFIYIICNVHACNMVKYMHHNSHTI